MYKKKQLIGVLLFDEVELLDFAGPMQVFLAARHIDSDLISQVTSIGVNKEVSISKSGTRVIAERTIDQFTNLDLLIIPGGIGTRNIVRNKAIMKEIDHMIDNSACCATVCTGSLVLAATGRLSGLRATTHYGALEDIQRIDGTIIVDRSQRVIDNGRYLISEGVSAGIDMAFYYLEKSFNKIFADEVRQYIEYYPGKMTSEPV